MNATCNRKRGTGFFNRHRPAVFTIPVLDALPVFEARVLAAVTVGEVETERGRIATLGFGSDETLLANDYCDRQIFSLTGHQLPALRPPPSELRPLNSASLFHAPATGDTLKLDLSVLHLSILDMVAEKDFTRARQIAEQLVHELRVLEIADHADPAGVLAEKH